MDYSLYMLICIFLIHGWTGIVGNLWNKKMPFNLITLKLWSLMMLICTYIAQKNKPKVPIHRCTLYWKYQIYNYTIAQLKFLKIYLTLKWEDWCPPRTSMHTIFQMPGNHHSNDNSCPATLLLGYCFPKSADSGVRGPWSRIQSMGDALQSIILFSLL